MIYAIVGIAIIVVALVVAVLTIRRRRPTDAVADFRRQIDALSPEARRSVVEQVNDHRQPADEAGAADGP